jgi:hypothetical protein
MCPPAGAAALRTLSGEPLTNADLTAARNEWLVTPPRWVQARLLPLLADARDAPLLFLLLNVAAVVPPAALALLRAPPSHALGAAYLLLVYALFLQRFMLALHFSQHRSLFKPGAWRGAATARRGACTAAARHARRRQAAAADARRFRARLPPPPAAEHWALNAVAPVLLAPFFGVPAPLYRLHHCVMHHGDGNAAPGDVSSTEPFQRDRPAHLLLYWLRYACFAALELPLWALRRRRDLAAQAVLGLACYVGAYRAAASVNATAALWLVPAPFYVSSLALMFGNWSQHVFVNPAAPRAALGMAYTCVNHGDNQRTFNDGYHAGHHANARTHWSELPAAFMAAAPAHAAADAIVFQGVHFFEVGAAVLCGERGLRWLARRYVWLGQPRRTEAELVAELRRRLAPIRLRPAAD